MNHQNFNSLARNCFVAMIFTTVPITAKAAPAPEASINSREAFDKIKGLAGQWQGTEGEKGKGPPIPIAYKVTASGSVVMETMFPGSDHEMITLYHMDGDKLTLTHYCSLRNQPVMALTGKSTSNDLVFDFAGGTNIKPKHDMHMHALRIRLDGKDSIATEWDLFQEGKLVDTKKFFFSRK